MYFWLEPRTDVYERIAMEFENCLIHRLPVLQGGSIILRYSCRADAQIHGEKDLRVGASNFNKGILVQI